jgi:hypothetical protein
LTASLKIPAAFSSASLILSKYVFSIIFPIC